MKTLYVRLAANLGDLHSGLNRGSSMITAYGAKANAQMSQIEKFAQKNQKELRTLGNIAGGVGVVAAVGVGIAIKKFAEFDQEMSHIQAATHASSSEMAALRAEAIQLGAATMYSAVEAGQGIEELAKAGISTADILNGGVQGALNLAAAGGLEVADAAQIAATALTQFNLQGKDIPHLADLLSAGAGKAQGSVQDLGAALGQSGLIAAAMGLSIEDTTGTLAAFASAGLLGSDAGTSFKTMIQRLQAPMGRGAKAMDKYNISAYDAKGNFIGITAVADQLKDKLAGLTDQQRNAALAQIFGSDAIRAATVLYRQGGDGMQKWIDKTNDAGYAAETARLRTANLAGDLERLGGSLDTLFINMGAGANGPMREMVQSLESMVNIGGAMPGWLLSTVTAGLALTAALGLTTFAATRLMGSVTRTRAGLLLMKTTAVSAAESLYLVATAGATAERAMVLRNAAKGAAVLGGIAIASGALGDSFGLANTASYALMGTMGGPLGTAAGAAVGFIMDVSHAGNSLSASFDNAKKSLDEATNFRGQIAGLDALEKAQDKTLKSISGSTSKFVSKHPLQTIKIGFDSVKGSNVFEKQAKDVKDAQDQVSSYQFAIQQLEDQTLGAKDGVNELFDPKRMQQFADQIGPVLEKAGLDLSTILKEGSAGKNWGQAVAAIQEWKAEADSADGRAKALRQAMADVDDGMLTTADSANDLAKALKGLFSPAMDYDAAIQKWKDGLAGLTGAMRKNGTSIDEHSVKSRANRAVIRDQVDALTGMVTAAAGAGKSSDELAAMVDKGRDSIIKQAEAAGVGKDAVSALLDEYGLTPDLVKTAIKTPGMAAARSNASGLLSSLIAINGFTADAQINIVQSFTTKGDKVSGSLNDMLLGGGGTHKPKKKKSGKKDQADGGYWPYGVPQAAANGLYNDAHMRRAGANQFIRYAEPETQGETFIPHAMSKRGKSTRYLGKTAALFGYDLSPRGMSSARGNTVVVQQAGRGPLIGSVAIGAGPRREVRGSLDELEKTIRKLERGGR